MKNSLSQSLLYLGLGLISTLFMTSCKSSSTVTNTGGASTLSNTSLSLSQLPQGANGVAVLNASGRMDESELPNLGMVVNARLSVDAGGPVQGDNAGTTTIYLHPYRGNKIPIFDGTVWRSYTLTGALSVAVPPTVNTNFDIFVYPVDSQTLGLETINWVNDVTRDVNRLLVGQDNMIVRADDKTRLYLGTARTGSISGLVPNTPQQRFLWNQFNRHPQILKNQGTYDSKWTDPNNANSYYYYYVMSLGQWAPANGTPQSVLNSPSIAKSRVEFVNGFNGSYVDIRANSQTQITVGNTNCFVYTGIAVNPVSGNWGPNVGMGDFAQSFSWAVTKAHATFLPRVGYSSVQIVELVNGGSSGNCNGTVWSLSPQYWSGLEGIIQD